MNLVLSIIKLGRNGAGYNEKTEGCQILQDKQNKEILNPPQKIIGKIINDAQEKVLY